MILLLLPDGTAVTSDQVTGFLYGADYLAPTPSNFVYSGF
jgi:hypothetical protein